MNTNDRNGRTIFLISYKVELNKMLEISSFGMVFDSGFSWWGFSCFSLFHHQTDCFDKYVQVAFSSIQLFSQVKLIIFHQFRKQFDFIFQHCSIAGPIKYMRSDRYPPTSCGHFGGETSRIGPIPAKLQPKQKASQIKQIQAFC